MTKKEENNYYQLCCDVMNLVEGNYGREETREAYMFASRETQRIDKKEERKVRWTKSQDLKTGKTKKIKVLEERHF